MSPGSYADYLNQLPKATRLVQGKFDLVFGIENCKRMNEKIKKHAPFAQIEQGNFGHLTISELEKAIPLMVRNARFVRQATGLKLI